MCALPAYVAAKLIVGDAREAHLLHGIEVIEIAPVFPEAVRGR
jgi:hypothetical protein